MKKIKFTDSFLYKTRERIIAGAVSMSVLSDHYSRYFFSSRYCKGKKVLNVASGCGYGSEVLVEGGALEVFNVDIDQNLIAFGNEKYGNYRNHFLTMDAQDLIFPDSYFDSIVSFETLEHLLNPEKFIKECCRVLKDDGIFILSTPNKKVSSPYTTHPNNKFHIKEWDYLELKNWLSDYFIIDNVFGQNYVIPNKKELPFLVYIKTTLNQIIYDFIPGSFFKAVKKYFLGYKEYEFREIIINAESKVKKTNGKAFDIDSTGRSYLVMIFSMKKKVTTDK